MTSAFRTLIRCMLPPLAATLSGCGFHLVGDRPLPEPLKSVHIDVIDPYHVTEPPLLGYLQARLVRRGAQIKGKAADAQTELRFYDLREGRETLTLGPDGKALEYRLITRISYEVRSADGTDLVPPETQAVSRDYSFNAQQILPKEAEELRLRKYIQDELSELVLLRIEAQLKAFTPGPAAPTSSTEVAPTPAPALPATEPAPAAPERPAPTP